MYFFFCSYFCQQLCLIVCGLRRRLGSVFSPLTLCGWLSTFHAFMLVLSHLSIFKWPKFSRTQYWSFVLFFFNAFFANDLDLAMKITMSFSSHKSSVNSSLLSLWFTHFTESSSLSSFFYFSFLLLHNMVPRNSIPQLIAAADARSHCFILHANKEMPNPSSQPKRYIQQFPIHPELLLEDWPNAHTTFYQTPLPVRLWSPTAETLQVADLISQPFHPSLCCSCFHSHIDCWIIF